MLSMDKETGLGPEASLASLFQPETALSAESFDIVGRGARLEPEKRLMLAVLADAVACFRNYLLAEDRRRHTMFRAAAAWIEERDSDWLFSFEHICDVLGMNPRHIRQGLTLWKEITWAVRRKTGKARFPTVVKGSAGGRGARRAGYLFPPGAERRRAF